MRAAIWTEQNAGGNLGNAEITSGSGVLTDIIGLLTDMTTGSDLYEIYITNPDTFRQRPRETPRKPIVDPALYLFDLTGNGLFGNDNISGGNDAGGVAGWNAERVDSGTVLPFNRTVRAFTRR